MDENPPATILSGPADITRPRQVLAAAALLERNLARLTPLDEDEAWQHAMVLCELADNALFHGRPQSGEPACRIVTSLDRTDGTLTIEVSDQGRGIPSHLRHSGNIAPSLPDDAALSQATAKGVTSSTERGRGMGLHSALNMASRPGYTLTIHSGSATLRVDADGGLSTGPAGPHAGTTVILTARLPVHDS